MTRRYVVVRTDKTAKPFILRELERGRLRQGWGYKDEYDLRLLRKRVDADEYLDDEEAAAWRNRRLLDTEPDGLKPGDVVVLPNLPEQGTWVLARVAGPYRYATAEEMQLDGHDYRHIVEVALIRDAQGNVAAIANDSFYVDARLRASMRNMSRMWSIDALAPAVESLIAAVEGGHDTATAEPEAKKVEGFFAAMRKAAWENIQSRYKGAEFEQLVHLLFQRVYKDGRVEHWGGAGEKGADLIVFTQDPLGLEFKIAVQIKLHDGVHDDTHALEQIRQAGQSHQVDAGVIVTTAVETSVEFERRREALAAELEIDIRVITRDEFVGLLMTYLGLHTAL